MSMRKYILVFLLVILGGPHVLASEFSEATYEVRIGDLDGDGDSDVHVNPVNNLVLIHGEVLIPVTIGIAEFTLLQGNDGRYALDNNPSAQSRQTAMQWGLANIELILEDFNIDGWMIWC